MISVDCRWSSNMQALHINTDTACTPENVDAPLIFRICHTIDMKCTKEECKGQMNWVFETRLKVFAMRHDIPFWIQKPANRTSHEAVTIPMFNFHVIFFYASNKASCAGAYDVACCVANSLFNTKLSQMIQVSISYTSGTYPITPTIHEQKRKCRAICDINQKATRNVQFMLITTSKNSTSKRVNQPIFLNLIPELLLHIVRFSW